MTSDFGRKADISNDDVCFKGALSGVDDARVHVWTGDRLADAAVKAGLFDWLVERASKSDFQGHDENRTGGRGRLRQRKKNSDRGCSRAEFNQLGPSPKLIAAYLFRLSYFASRGRDLSASSEPRAGSSPGFQRPPHHVHDL